MNQLFQKKYILQVYPIAEDSTIRSWKMIQSWSSYCKLESLRQQISFKYGTKQVDILPKQIMIKYQLLFIYKQLSYFTQSFSILQNFLFGFQYHISYDQRSNSQINLNQHSSFTSQFHE
ncbi:unnamed protein product [Paramecium octaurelia]|uniref:Uncharacterized protein n=1 Tax=Paramecium octaurelia TaxID=43137 RepID=A0A8S1VEY0_PAROT|nr:unnamed protein product [Paramecium octaurelia]